MSVYCSSSTAQDQIQLMHSNSDDIPIKADETIEFSFRITGKFVGSSYAEFIWDFNDFRIRRKINFEVLCESVPNSRAEQIVLNTVSTNHITAWSLIEKSKGEIMPGRRHALNSVFVPVKVGQFLLPQNAYFAVLPEEKINFRELQLKVENVFPCLKDGLAARNYKEYMHTLLFLEEIEKLRLQRKMDIEGAPFRRHLDYLILDVPELSSYTKEFLPGDFVIISLPWDKDKKFQGIIHRITKTELWLKFAKSFHETYQQGSFYFISFHSSRTQIRRMHHAIDIAMKHLGKSWLFPESVITKPPQVIFEGLNENLEADSKSRHQFTQFNNGIKSKTENEASIQNKTYKMRGHGKMWNRSGAGCGSYFNAKEYNDPIDPKKFNEIKWYNKMLNKQQKLAVLRILQGKARPMPYIVFGPPGTGKTITVVEAILQLHHLLPNCRILVATPTNSAADLIGERLIDSGNLQDGDFLRLVGISFLEKGRLTASLIPFSATPSFKDETSNEGTIDDVQAFNRQQISEHRIIVSTIGCLGVLYNMGFPRGFFTHIFVDEAGQATEPELMIPMAFLSLQNGSVTLSGDPLQLGPLVQSNLAITYGLQESFLVRLLSRFPYIKDLQGYPNNFGYDPRLVTELINNYRSLDGILQLYNSLYYNGDLIAKISSDKSEEAIIFQNLKSLKLNFPVLLHGVQGSCLQETNSTSWYNPQEVFLVFTYLNNLYLAGLHPDQIGIITPYQMQAQKIRDMLEYHNLEAPKAGSVEEYQGQERMVIILSLVKCSDNNENCDFVTDPKRMNVAISRARALLIIIGDPELMVKDVHWFKALSYCIKNNAYVGCEIPSHINFS